LRGRLHLDSKVPLRKIRYKKSVSFLEITSDLGKIIPLAQNRRDATIQPERSHITISVTP